MKKYDVIVIGGGHAGCEAALAASRMGCSTLMLTLELDKIALMPCNPAIGGVGKGHIVREIDALGGEMAKVIDKTGIQFRVLNASKGPAVHGNRAQADKKLYSREMQRVLQRQPGLDISQEEAEELIVRENVIEGIRTVEGSEYLAKTVIITAGTFLRGLIHIGLKNFPAGRVGEKPSNKLSDSFLACGFETGRLKTGTPPRLLKDTIDFSQCEVQEGDKIARPFSFSTDFIDRDQVPCHLTYYDETGGLRRHPDVVGEIDGDAARTQADENGRCHESILGGNRVRHRKSG